MKVLFLYGSSSRNSGGLYNSVRNLGKSLLNINGVKPVALAYDDEYSEKDLPAYAPLAVEKYHISGLLNLGYSRDMKKKIEEIGPDILHPQCLWLYTSYETLQQHRKFNTPYLISPRGMLDEWIVNNNRWKKNIAAFFFEKAHLKNASCIHALCLPEYNSIRKYGCKNPVAIIPNGVSLPEDNLPDEFKLPEWKSVDNRKILLFLSRLHPKKGLENLMQAWSKLDDHRNDWKLVIAGESSDKNYLQSLYDLQKKFFLEKDIFFIGPQFHKEKDICFRCADAFILPSFSEGLPMAVLEAWSYKLPVIMTEACNLPEGFEKNAALKITTDPENITGQLNSFLSMNSNEQNIFGQNGYELVKEKFTWPSIASQMHELYQWVLNGGPAPSTVIFD